MVKVRTGATVQGGHPEEYYSQARPELAGLVPARCRRVLDVGCGTGELGKLLKTRGHHVTGIELDPGAASRAAHHLDHALCVDVEASPLPFAPCSFDAIILADILEHLIDPWRVLKELTPLVGPDGIIVASIPNLQNIDVLRRLALGRWDYRERGITDRGHLRFFTLQTIRKLFAQAGLTITSVGHRYRPSVLRSVGCFLTAGRLKCYLARQYLVIAERPKKA